MSPPVSSRYYKHALRVVKAQRGSRLLCIKCWSSKVSLLGKTIQLENDCPFYIWKTSLPKETNSAKFLTKLPKFNITTLPQLQNPTSTCILTFQDLQRYHTKSWTIQYARLQAAAIFLPTTYYTPISNQPAPHPNQDSHPLSPTLFLLVPP